jgi:hypothetical protein
MSDRALVRGTGKRYPKPSGSSSTLEDDGQDGVECAVLYPTLAGFSGERFGAISDPGLNLACMKA